MTLITLCDSITKKEGGIMAIDVNLPMGMDFLLKGHDNVQLELRIGDYLTDEFFKTYTNFESFGEFIYFSPYTDAELTINSKLFETYDMNRYIELTTQFHSYSEMFKGAVESALENLIEEE